MSKDIALAKKLHAEDPASAGTDFDLTFYKRHSGIFRPAISEETRNSYIAQARAKLGL